MNKRKRDNLRLYNNHRRDQRQWALWHTEIEAANGYTITHPKWLVSTMKPLRRIYHGE